MTATYFVVTRRSGRESPALYYDWLPAWMTSKRAAELGLVFVYRLDTAPAAARWLSMSLGEVWAVYQRLAAGQRLPASNLAVRRQDDHGRDVPGGAAAD